MKYTVKCQIGDRKFDRNIVGTLANTEQEFDVTVNYDEEAERIGMKSVTPIQNTEVVWTDTFGDTHHAHYFAHAAIVVPAEFVREYRR